MLERYHAELLSFLRSKVACRDTAADLVQESYVRVLTLQQKEKLQEPRALLYKVANNLVIDQYRRAAVRQHTPIDELEESQHPPAPLHQQPDQALASMQMIQAFVATIEALPPRCREAFVLHIFDEMPQAKVAERMGVSVSMVEKHVVRGMVACKACERQLLGPY